MKTPLLTPQIIYRDLWIELAGLLITVLWTYTASGVSPVAAHAYYVTFSPWTTPLTNVASGKQTALWTVLANGGVDLAIYYVSILGGILSTAVTTEVGPTVVENKLNKTSVGTHHRRYFNWLTRLQNKTVWGGLIFASCVVGSIFYLDFWNFKFSLTGHEGTHTAWQWFITFEHSGYTISDFLQRVLIVASLGLFTYGLRELLFVIYHQNLDFFQRWSMLGNFMYVLTNKDNTSTYWSALLSATAITYDLVLIGHYITLNTTVVAGVLWPMHSLLGWSGILLLLYQYPMWGLSVVRIVGLVDLYLDPKYPFNPLTLLGSVPVALSNVNSFATFLVFLASLVGSGLLLLMYIFILTATAVPYVLNPLRDFTRQQFLYNGRSYVLQNYARFSHSNTQAQDQGLSIKPTVVLKASIARHKPPRLQLPGKYKTVNSKYQVKDFTNPYFNSGIGPTHSLIPYQMSQKTALPLAPLLYALVYLLVWQIYKLIVLSMKYFIYIGLMYYVMTQLYGARSPSELWTDAA